MRNVFVYFAAAAMVVAAANAAGISPSTVNLRVNSPRSNALCLGSKMIREAIAMERLRGGGKLKVAFLTAGGLAPCLSSSIGYLIEIYNEYDPDIEIIGYVDGYKVEMCPQVFLCKIHIC
jgi:hypothetical protein